MRRVTLCAVAAWLALAPAAPAAKQSIELTISAGKHDRAHEPVCVPLQVPKKLAGAAVQLLDDKDKDFPFFVLSGPSLATRAITAKEGHVRQDLHFILPGLKAGRSVVYKLVFNPEAKSGARGEKDGFTFKVYPEPSGGTAQLTFLPRPPAPLTGDRKVLDYVYPKLDDSSPARREATYKVFHRLYSPDGSQQLTKDAGGKFTHHRGLFYGFSKTTYDGATVDIWHCKGDTHQAHTKVEVAGWPASAPRSVLHRHLCHIDWNGQGKKTFAKELRELTVYNVPGGNLIEFVSQLTPTGGDVKLDGDPQHAGFHFRAADEVASKSSKQTVFIRPGGVGKPGTEVNWPKNKGHVNLPWLAMSFVVGGKRYTAAYLDHPKNPKEARFSERTYGRFGSYFVTTVTKERPLVVRYRIWLQEGQMKPEEVKAKSAAFVSPVDVKVKKS